MQREIEQLVESNLTNIYQLLQNKAGQFLVLSPDEDLLEIASNMLAKHSKYKIVRVIAERDQKPARKIFLINLHNKRSISYQSLLYYYLELPLRFNCFVGLFSSSSLCLNYFEKRVLSRFNHRIAFIPYFDSFPSGSYLHPSLQSIQNHQLIKKYDLEEFTLGFLFDLFEPLHIAMLVLSSKRKLKITNCISEFRNFVVHISELKGVSNTEIFNKYCDLQDSGMISQSGELLADISELKEFVQRNSPVYLKRLVSNKTVRR